MHLVNSLFICMQYCIAVDKPAVHDSLVAQIVLHSDSVVRVTTIRVAITISQVINKIFTRWVRFSLINIFVRIMRQGH